MALDKIVNVGKYEAIPFIQNEETAKDYLDACIHEIARHSGCNVKETAATERSNIL
jgi:hypothetical protein